VINEVLHLSKAWYADAGVNGVVQRLANLPRLPSDSASVSVEIHCEIDLTPQGKDLATNRIPDPGAGKVLMGLTLARGMFGLDAHLMPPVRDHEIPVAHWFARRVSDSARGTRDLGYVFRAALHSLERLKQVDATAVAARTLNGVQMLFVKQTVPLPTYQRVEEVELLMGFIAVWETRDTTPKGV
jgi:hypothetical protein